MARTRTRYGAPIPYNKDEMYGQLTPLATTQINPSFPVNLLVADRCCLVVGGGTIALRKARGLLASGASVTVVAPEIVDDFHSLEVAAITRRYEATDLRGKWLVITAADDPEVNAQVSADANEAMVWVNSADDIPNCSFTMPAVAWRDELSIAISTGGKSPAMASWLRRKFESEFDERYSDLLNLLAEVRAEAKAELGTSEVPGWIEALDEGLLDLVSAGDGVSAKSQLRASLGLRTAA